MPLPAVCKRPLSAPLWKVEKPKKHRRGAYGNPPRRSAPVSDTISKRDGAYGAAATIAFTVQKSLSIAPMLMYQHSRSGVCWPGR